MHFGEDRVGRQSVRIGRPPAPKPPKNYDSSATEGRVCQKVVLLVNPRRSTRVALKIVISVQGLNEPLTCDGETITVNRHGALIYSSVPLRIEMKIEIQVVLTSKRGHAKVVYVDPDRPRLCGIALEKPENIWGVSFPPDDWFEEGHES